MKTIYLARHGQTLFNRLGRVQGCSDSPLTEAGEQKAAALGRTFREAGIAFDGAFSSDLGRARQTANRILAQSQSPDLHLIETKDLREVSFGVFEGGSADLMWRQAGAAAGNPDLHDFSPDSQKIQALDALKKLDTTGLAENQEDVRKRVFRLADTFASSDHSIILAVSHGLFTNCLIHFLSNGSIPVTSIKNTSVTKLIYDQGTFTFDYIGRTENL